MNISKLGVVQGRLIQAPPGYLQWFPQEFWEGEFYLAHSLGLQFIEIVAERQFNPHNPIWTEEGLRRIRELAEVNSLLLETFCDDYLIDHSILGGSGSLDHSFKLIDRGALLNLGTLVVPLFEQSELTSANSREFVQPLRRLADYAEAKGIRVCLETMLLANELLDFLNVLNHGNIKVVFDSGNRAAVGADLREEIRVLGSSIQHIHIKDKDAAGKNVILGTGKVNFLSVFQELDSIGYKGCFTFETQRGIDPVRTMKFNLDLVSFFAREAQDSAV